MGPESPAMLPAFLGPGCGVAVGSTDGTGVWECVDVQSVKAFPRPVTLAEIKATEALANLELVKLSRLSVSKVSEAEWKLLCKMGGL